MKRLFCLMLLAVLVFGCATTSAIYQACKPPLTDETEAVTELFNRPDLTTAEKVAAAEGGKIASCVVTEIAKDIIAKAATLAFAAPRSFAGGMFEEPPLVATANAWVAKHP